MTNTEISMAAELAGGTTESMARAAAFNSRDKRALMVGLDLMVLDEDVEHLSDGWVPQVTLPVLSDDGETTTDRVFVRQRVGNALQQAVIYTEEPA